MRITKRQLRRIIREEAVAAGDNLSIEEIAMLEQEVGDAQAAVIDAIDVLHDFTKIEPALLNIKLRTAQPYKTDQIWSNDLSERFHSCKASLSTLLKELRHRAVVLRQRRERIEKSGSGTIV